MANKSWIDAITDLEESLRRGIVERDIVHRSLAIAYAETGESDLAKLHAEGVSSDRK